MNATPSKFLSLFSALAVIWATAFGLLDAQAASFPKASQTGAPMEFEIWQWGPDAADRAKVTEIKNNMQISRQQFLAGMQLFVRIPTAHDQISFTGYFPDKPKSGWGPDKVDSNVSETNLYHLGNDSIVPETGKYCLDVEAKKEGKLVSKTVIIFEIIPMPLPKRDGLLSVGYTDEFPKPMHSGAHIELQLCESSSDQIADWKVLLTLKNGDKINWRELPAKGDVNYRFRIPVEHDTLTCNAISTDAFQRFGWGPEKITDGPTPSRFYRLGPNVSPLPMTPGKYSISVEASNKGKSVAKTVVQFTVLDKTPPPRNTHFLDGKKDCKDNPITFSKPVDLPEVNETSVLKDNDYPFEPQHAYNTVNFERFPPFSLPPRFIQVWGTRRFTDEPKIGGPLNRGFTSIATYQPSLDNLTKLQRNNFHTEGLQILLINQWYKKDPKKYQDLKNYISDGRSMFVSAENAYELGKACYSSCGTYGWDEEWIGDGGGVNLFKKYPEMLPKELLELKKKDPEAKLAETQEIVKNAYVRAWGDFIGNGYRGARDAAKAQGRTIKVWHYGSKSPNTTWFRPWEDMRPNAAGKYSYEDIARLPSWFKTGDKLNFYASEYSRQIDFFSHDFYYWNTAPEYMSMYEKNSQGKYVFDNNGRRKIRHDMTQEKIYIDSQKYNDDDYENTPIFLKSFIAKGENCLYFQNGAKYYKQHGTCITEKELIPFHRLRNQETGFGKSAQLGSRPNSPYYAEAATIFTFMMGLEGLYYWDAGNTLAPEGFGPANDPVQYWTFGEIEFVIKGLHRVSQFKNLFEGNYYFVRPFRHYDTVERDNPLIRGILNDRYLVLAMTNPYLDPGETQAVEIWYDAPYGKKAIWSDKVTLNARKTSIFQCKLPKPPKGQAYDPDRLYFRYTCADGNYNQTHIVTGNYDVTYEKSLEQKAASTH